MSNVVDAVVAQLRRKLGKPSLIMTVRGVGFVVADDADRGRRTADGWKNNYSVRRGGGGPPRPNGELGGRGGGSRGRLPRRTPPGRSRRRALPRPAPPPPRDG